jgi:hypothetical protein
VRTHLDYASSVWAPYKKKYIYFLKLVLYRCWTILLLLFLLLNLFPELESSFKKELASRSYFSFMSLYVSIISVTYNYQILT